MGFVSGFYSFNLSVSNSDTGFYDTWRIKTPRHPLESLEYLFARVLAYAHSYREGLQFSQGLFDLKEPTIWQKDICGEVTAWIELGCPELEKLNRSLRRNSQAEFRIYFYEPQQIEQFCHLLRGSKSNWVQSIQFFMIDPQLLSSMVPLEKSSSELSLTFVDSALYLSFNGIEINGSISRVDIWEHFQHSISNAV